MQTIAQALLEDEPSRKTRIYENVSKEDLFKALFPNFDISLIRTNLAQHKEVIGVDKSSNGLMTTLSVAAQRLHSVSP